MKLIRLKNLTPYFFGYNETFGKKGSNYLVISALYPQQTAVLGMLRKELLSQQGLLERYLKDEWVNKSNRKKALELVGVGKFMDFNQTVDEIDYSNQKIVNKFNLGKIKHISPLFLIKNDEILFRAPNIKAIYKKDGEWFIDFDYKNFDYIFISTDGKRYSFSDIFESIEVVGNSIKDSEDSLYKKICYTLKDDFEFGFFVDGDFELSSSVVKLGADNSMFRMKVEESSISFDEIEIKKYFECDEKVSLVVGDSYIEDLDSDFSIVDEVVFNTIKQTRKFIKYTPINLYQKGSLFINLKNNLPKNAAYKIGFNNIKELK